MKTPRRAQSPKRAQSTKKQRPVRAWVLRDPEMLRLGFQMFDDLTTLRQHCRREVAFAREFEYLFQNFPLEPDESGLQRWQRVLARVTECWRVVDDLVRTNRLDAAQCQTVYRDLIWIRTAWERIKGPAHFLALITRIRNHMRQVLIQSAQQPGHRD